MISTLSQSFQKTADFHLVITFASYGISAITSKALTQSLTYSGFSMQFRVPPDEIMDPVKGPWIGPRNAYFRGQLIA
jgi:hypothetical protein